MLALRIEGGVLLLLVNVLCKRTLLFEGQSSLPGPPLKMAANPSPEVKAILKQTHDLTTALSNDWLGVAGILLSKELISGDVWSKILLPTFTPAEKAAILVEAVRNTVELAPVKFQCFLEVLSGQGVVMERLRSTYQSESNH